MIIKIHDPAELVRDSLDYNVKKVKKGKAQCVFSNQMQNIHLEQDIPLEACVKYFEVLEKANIRTQKPVLHVSFNPDPEDKITEEDINNMIVEYMHKMGYGQQPYCVFKHRDIDRLHYHIVAYRVMPNGKKINDSFEKRRSRAIAVEFEDKFKLVKSKNQQRSKGKKTDINAKTIKNIRDKSELVLKYNVCNIKEYIAVMESADVKVEEISYVDQVTGQESFSCYFQGMRNGEKATPIISAKDVGIDMQTLKDSFEKNKKLSKNIGAQNKLRGVIGSCMSHATSFTHFQRMLKKKNVDVKYNINSDGRIFGVYFIDHTTKNIFKGSELGKAYSANIFESKREVWTEGERKGYTKQRKITFDNQEYYRVQHSRPNTYFCIAARLTNFYIPDSSSDFFKDLRANQERQGGEKMQLTLNN
ncbi:MAG: relaxase/mobilization nuclease domain-containing protein [Bacilli bacterium]